jgi:hypothetical protein
MLELLKSEYVSSRYAEEYRKAVELCNSAELSVIIFSLYMASLGHDAPIVFLSNIFAVDADGIVDKLQDNYQGLQVLRVSGTVIKTVPSIGAENILREIVPKVQPRIVVDTIVRVLNWLSFSRDKSDFEVFIFNQLMRYSLLATVVKDVSEQNRFFDNVSKIDNCRNQVLFWLQWHMAMVDQSRFVDAQTYLDRSYTEAELYERRTQNKYDRYQLDDRGAKFQMTKLLKKKPDSQDYYEIKKACDAVERGVRRETVTHHSFETLSKIIEAYKYCESGLGVGLRGPAINMIRRVSDLAIKRVSELDEGFPKSQGTRAIELANSLG